MRIAKGSHRFVIVFGCLAFKFPRIRRLIAGALANLEELRLWREGWHRFYPELCPVRTSFLFGVVLVMPSARIMSDVDLDAFTASADFSEPLSRPLLDEDKQGEWGWLADGRPVIVDYAMRVHMTASEIDEIAHRTRTIEGVTAAARQVA